MNIFKKVAASLLASATMIAATAFTFTASATIVTDKNDDGNFVYSSQFNDCRTGAAGGYVWDTAAKQGLYPEFSKSYLSTKRTFVSPKTYSTGIMIGLLDKSITSWHDAIQYACNLNIKDNNDKVVTFRVERDFTTGRFGLRAMDFAYPKQFDTQINHSWVERSGKTYYHYIAIQMEGVYPGAWITIPGYTMVECTHTYTGAREYLYDIDGNKYYFGDFDEEYANFDSTGGAMFLLAKELGTHFNLSEKRVSGKTESITVHANGITGKTNLTASYNAKIPKFNYGARGVDTAPITKKYNCLGYAFGVPIWGNLYNYDDHVYISRSLTTTDNMLILTKLRLQQWLNNKGFANRFREVSGYDAILEDDEWLVAMRVGKNSITYDYHFWYRASNGKWYNKHGSYVSEECSGNVIDPSIADNSDGWACGSETGFYDSDTVYYAVKML